MQLRAGLLLVADEDDRELIGYFVGQTVKAMQGKANPQVVNEVLRAKLG